MTQTNNINKTNNIMNTELVKKYTAHSTKVLQKMTKVKTGEELEAVNAVLSKRGHQATVYQDSSRVIINPTETSPYKEENGITEEEEKAQAKEEKAQAKEEKAQAKEEKAQAKEEKTSAKAKTQGKKEQKPLKKTRPREEAEQLRQKALLYKGHRVTVKTFVGHQEVTGTIIGVRLDPRSNFVQYRIKLENGTIIGKGVDSPDVPSITEVEGESAAEALVSTGD